MTKDKIEKYLYNFSFYLDELDKANEEIKEVEAQRDEEYEKYPQMNLDKIRVMGGCKDNPTIQAVIKIIDKYDKELRRLRNARTERFGDFLTVRAAVKLLTPSEFNLVVAKYWKRLKGQKLYEELNYTCGGCYKLQARILDKLKLYVNGSI